MRELVTKLEAAGISQAELARRSGRQVSLICDVIAGRRRRFSPEAAADIAEAFNSSPEAKAKKLLLDVDDLLFPKDRPAPRRQKTGTRRAG